MNSKAFRLELESQITCFAFSGEILVVTLQNLLVKLFAIDFENNSNKLLREFKAHEAPVLAMDFDASGHLVATGSADSTIKCWDVRAGHATHNFKGHSGIISTVKFHPKKLFLASGSDDCKVKVWDLKTKSCMYTLTSHVSVIRDLDYSPCGHFLFSGARDKVFTKWSLDSGEIEFTIPIYESVEALQVIQKPLWNRDAVLITGGEKAKLRAWDLDNGECLWEQPGVLNAKFEIASMGWMDEELVVTTSDQNILFYQAKNGQLVREKMIAGYNEEILDLALIGEDSHLAVISNSEQVYISIFIKDTSL